MHNSMSFGNSNACFARVIENSSRIIVGVQAKKSMSASTKRNSEKRISGALDKGMGPLASTRAFSDGCQGESIEHSLMDPQREGGAQTAQQYVRPETQMLALRLPVGESIEHSLKRT